MDYSNMTLQELKDIAKELGIKGVSAMKKGELADLLTAVKGHQIAEKKKLESESAGDAADNKKPEGEKRNSGKRMSRKERSDKTENTIISISIKERISLR